MLEEQIDVAFDLLNVWSPCRVVREVEGRQVVVDSNWEVTLPEFEHKVEVVLSGKEVVPTGKEVLENWGGK